MIWLRRTKPATGKTQAKGQAGEDAAAHYLQLHGYKIIERNWRPGNSLRGEIDCIAWHHDQRNVKMLCFIEVKTRSSNRKGAPQDAVTQTKQRQLSKLANSYVAMRKWNDTPCRFDVVEVWLQDGSKPTFALHENAFDYQE
jgi:putative endonuclease